MKIEIDTTNKTVTAENATLGELFEFIQKIENWKEFIIKSELDINIFSHICEPYKKFKNPLNGNTGTMYVSDGITTNHSITTNSSK